MTYNDDYSLFITNMKDVNLSKLDEFNNMIMWIIFFYFIFYDSDKKDIIDIFIKFYSTIDNPNISLLKIILFICLLLSKKYPLNHKTFQRILIECLELYFQNQLTFQKTNELLYSIDISNTKKFIELYNHNPIFYEFLNNMVKEYNRFGGNKLKIKKVIRKY